MVSQDFLTYAMQHLIQLTHHAEIIIVCGGFVT